MNNNQNKIVGQKTQHWPGRFRRNLLLLAVVSAAFLPLTSCKKEFLNIENTQNLYRESYVKDLTTLREYLNGTYTSLAINDAYFNSSAYSEVISDNMKPASVSPTTLIPHYSWMQVAGQYDVATTVGADIYSTGMGPLWTELYKIIRVCNFSIENTNKYRTENPVLADNLKGQALALRAYIHFRLVSIFAQQYTFSTDASHPGIPYVTSSDITEPFSRQSVAEVYSYMVADFIDAIQLLPSGNSDTRFMTKNAARALLARAYLFKEDFANAKMIGMEIANEIPLMTTAQGYPDGVFKIISNSETLFRLTPRTSSAGGTYNTFFLGRVVRSAFRFYATNDIAIVLKEHTNDARQAWTNNVSGNWQVLKFPLSATGTPALSAVAAGDYYHPVIRSSEMFLTVAEASAKSGDENTARTYLNAIRKRAYPAIADVTATGGALLDSIYKERRKELCFEGLRMFDLQRWKKNVQRGDVLPGYPTTLTYPNNKAIAPIPYSDVTVGGLPQNPGY